MSNDQQGPDPRTDPQSGYAPQPGAYGAPQPTTTDPLSIGALVTGLLGLGIVPIVLGILGLRRTKVNGTSGRGLAITGIVLGALEVLSGVIFIALAVVAALIPATLGLDTSTSGESSISESTAAPTADAGEADPAEDGSTPDYAVVAFYQAYPL